MTYTDWGKDVLESYGLVVNGVFSPVASNDYFPISQVEINKFKKIIREVILVL